MVNKITTSIPLIGIAEDGTTKLIDKVRIKIKSAYQIACRLFSMFKLYFKWEDNSD